MQKIPVSSLQQAPQLTKLFNHVCFKVHEIFLKNKTKLKPKEIQKLDNWWKQVCLINSPLPAKQFCGHSKKKNLSGNSILCADPILQLQVSYTHSCMARAKPSPCSTSQSLQKTHPSQVQLHTGHTCLYQRSCSRGKALQRPSHILWNRLQRQKILLTQAKQRKHVARM